MKCLITGGAGFIGSHIGKALAARGDKVRVLDDLSSGHLSNISDIPGLDFHQGSICDQQTLRAALDGVDTVFHLAALVSVPESIQDPRRCLELNDIAVLDLYRLAAECGVKKVVYSSSAAVYGRQPVPHGEDRCPSPVASPYAMHKLLGEQYGCFFAEKYGFEVVNLRYFNVFGPRQRPDSPYSGVISIFMDRLQAGLPVTIHGDGSQSRDFVYVQDVVRANLAAADSAGLSGESINIASGTTHSINELYAELSALAGVKAAPQYAPPRAGDIKHSSTPVGKAEKLLGFKAETSFREGLRATWDWFVSSGTN